jgi:gamma-tubulin complex component 5
MFAHVQVKSVFQVLQGFETSFLYWDDNVPGYREKSGVYVAHLSLTGLGSMLNPFLFAATCLKHAEIFVGKVRTCRRRIPTLDAFAGSVDSWLTVSEVPIQDMHSFL